MPNAIEPLIYQLKVVLSGISPMILQRILVHSDSTIAERALHARLLQWAGLIPTYITSSSTESSMELLKLAALGLATTQHR